MCLGVLLKIMIEQEVNEFQDTILRGVQQHKAPYQIDLKGRDFVLFPEVFNPNYAKAALLLLDHLGVQEGDAVLDPFTGCGADAIFAVLQGASKAVAIDKFTMPYLCARYNVARLNLEDSIDVRQGDLFEVLNPEEKFDLIIANPPFRNMEASSNIAAALRDKNYHTLKTFFRNAYTYLKPDGRMRIVFSDVGDMENFDKLADKNGFSLSVIAEQKYGAAVRMIVQEARK